MIYMKRGKAMLKWVDRLVTLFLIACGMVIVWIILQVTSFTTFHIPSASMEPALLPCDNILVNKWIMGARIFNIQDAIDKEPFKIFRLPGLGKIRRNDVLVFNYPYASHTDSIAMDVLLYYVKRCIALPGDTLEIKNGYYRIHGVEDDLGNVAAQKRISHLTETEPCGVMMRSFPWSEKIHWTIKNFGSLPVPAKGTRVLMDSTTAILYHRLISWEQKKKLLLKDDAVCLADSAITEYAFQENYYFVSGDNMENSEDSRYWGLLPESYIVGKATLIWKSQDKASGEIRWNRVFKKIE